MRRPVDFCVVVVLAHAGGRRRVLIDVGGPSIEMKDETTAQGMEWRCEKSGENEFLDLQSPVG